MHNGSCLLWEDLAGAFFGGDAVVAVAVGVTVAGDLVVVGVAVEVSVAPGASVAVGVLVAVEVSVAPGTSVGVGVTVAVAVAVAGDSVGVQVPVAVGVGRWAAAIGTVPAPRAVTKTRRTKSETRDCLFSLIFDRVDPVGFMAPSPF